MESALGRTKSAADRARRFDVAELQQCFAKWLGPVEGELRAERLRLFFPARTFWLFLSQILAGNISCHETLQKALAWLCYGCGQSASPNTAGYCKARQRLGLGQIQRIAEHVVARLEGAVERAQLWHGRRVLVVDGSGLSMPDSEANQKRFPQPSGQKKGCGFPTMRIVALFSLATGAMIAMAQGTLKTCERTLFHQLWTYFKAGDIVLADRGFPSFADFFLLLEKGVDCVMRNHQRRKKGVRVVRRLGARDKLVAWTRSGRCPKWLEKNQWEAMPRELLVRQIDLLVQIPGFRTRSIVIVTTLLDQKRYGAADFAELYRRRWLAEIFLRDIKTSLGMDILKCKSPAMVLKEIAMYQIAYNLIRALMFEAAQRRGGDPQRISFKGTASSLRQWAPVFAAAAHDPRKSRELHNAFLDYIARNIVPYRPNRTEPRALKRRMKNYQLLNKPRAEYKEIYHRNHYKKGLS